MQEIFREKTRFDSVVSIALNDIYVYKKELEFEDNVSWKYLQGKEHCLIDDT